MKKYLLFILSLGTFCTFIGCRSAKQAAQLIREVRTDTLYLSSQHYDSIFVSRDHFTDRSRDTIYIKDSILEFRYKLLRDTVYKVQHDSIPYEVRIETVREVPRRRNILDYISYACLGLVIGSVLTRLYHYFR